MFSLQIGILSRYQIILPMEEKTMLRMNPDKIPDLHWNLTDTYHTTNIGQIDSHTTWISTNCINVDTLNYAGGDRYKEWCGTTLSTNMTILHSHKESIVCPGNGQNKKYMM